jgi:hypothetical protein
LIALETVVEAGVGDGKWRRGAFPLSSASRRIVSSERGERGARAENVALSLSLCQLY